MANEIFKEQILNQFLNFNWIYFNWIFKLNCSLNELKKLINNWRELNFIGK